MKKLYHFLFALAALLPVLSCTPEVDDAFDKPSPERIAEAISHTKEVLVAAPNGWRMDYQGAGGYGGYNILCKFDADDNVFCEEESENVKATSHYRLQQGQGVLLSFDSFNAALHKYSDPVGRISGKTVGTDGKGFQGDFEFRVMSCNKDSIILEGRKHGDRVVMTPMPENLTWDNYFSQLSTVIKGMRSERYNIILDNDTLPAQMNLHTLYTTDAEGKEVAMPFIYTTKGMRMMEKQTLNGKTITAFTYSTDEKWIDENDATVRLTPREITPVEAFFSDSWTFDAEYSSTAEVDIWKTAAAYAASQNHALSSLCFGVRSGRLCLSAYMTTGWGDVRVKFAASGKDQLTITGFSTNSKGNDREKRGAEYYSKYKLKDIAATFLAKGKAATYTLTTDNPKEPSFLRMTSNSDSKVSFVFDRGIWRVDL